MGEKWNEMTGKKKLLKNKEKLWVDAMHLLLLIYRDIKSLHLTSCLEKNPGKNFTGLSLSSRPKEREQCHDDSMRQWVWTGQNSVEW